MRQAAQFQSMELERVEAVRGFQSSSRSRLWSARGNRAGRQEVTAFGLSLAGDDDLLILRIDPRCSSPFTNRYDTYLGRGIPHTRRSLGWSQRSLDDRDLMNVWGHNSGVAVCALWSPARAFPNLTPLRGNPTAHHFQHGFDLPIPVGPIMVSRSLVILVTGLAPEKVRGELAIDGEKAIFRAAG